MNQFNNEEFLSICNKYNKNAYQKDIIIEYKNKSFFERMKRKIKEDRRGEVVFCVKRPNGKYITVTCEEYPEGVFRIPTGGLGHNEDIVKGVFREVKEELGLEVLIEDFLGVLKIKFVYNSKSVMFYSYIFMLKETGGRILKDACDDEISEVWEVDQKEMQKVVSSLIDIETDWVDWGRFRYESTKAVLDYIKT